MISPKKMPVVIAIAMSLSAIMYVIFGFLGYRKYSILACDTVIKNLPLDDLWVSLKTIIQIWISQKSLIEIFVLLGLL